MAKQTGQHVITGTYNNLCFYKMEGAYYVRRKSSLSGKRVKRDAAFKKTMYYAGLMGDASRIASAIYKQLPAVKKIKGLYRSITGAAMHELKSGESKEAVFKKLYSHYFKKTIIKKPFKAVSTPNFLFTALLLENLFTDRIPASESISSIYPLAHPP